MDFMRESIKDEIKGKIVQNFFKNSKTIAQLILLGVRRQDNTARTELNRLVIPVATRTAKKYFNPALDAGKSLATHIIIEIEKIKIDKSKKKATKKAIELENKDVLIAQLDRATKRYVFDSEELLESLLFNEVGKKPALDEIEKELKMANGQAGRYFNAITAATQGYVFKVADSAMQDAFAFKDIQNSMRWVTFFTKSCHECAALHNMVLDYKEWKYRGLPRSGVTVCKSHCHCVIIPEEYPIDISAPVQREKARITKPPKQVKKTIIKGILDRIFQVG